MHGTLVVKESVLEQHSWVAKSLFNAYAAAKAEWLPDFSAGKTDAPTDGKYRALPFGVEAMSRSLSTRYLIT